MRLGTGGYPDVSLATAREKFDIAKVKVKNGIDPLSEQDQAKISETEPLFVADFVTEYVDRVPRRDFIEFKKKPLSFYRELSCESPCESQGLKSRKWLITRQLMWRRDSR